MIRAWNSENRYHRQRFRLGVIFHAAPVLILLVVYLPDSGFLFLSR
jgi:hypothetical protein